MPELAEIKTPKAYKIISKVLYLNDIQPPISKQGHDSKMVLGATGEALTELILPPYNDLPPNNRGYDLDYENSFIEVKSTVESKVSLSNIQFEIANYLVIHVYHKHTDDYCHTYLIPLKILKAIKGEKSGDVTINIYKESWVKFFKVTLMRLHQFFKVRRMYLDGNPSSLIELRHKDLLDSAVFSQKINIISLFSNYPRCGSWKWERRYAYYEYYQNRHPEWEYEYNSLSGVTDLGLYAIYKNNQWIARPL